MPTPDPIAEPTTLVVEEDIVVRQLMHSFAPFWDIAQQWSFWCSFRKGTQEHESSGRYSHSLRCVMQLFWISSWWLVQNVTRQRFLVVTICSIYGSIKFLNKTNISTSNTAANICVSHPTSGIYVETEAT